MNYKLFSKLLLNFIMFRLEYKKDKTVVKIIKRIQVLFFFLKTYNIAFWIIFKTPLIVSFLGL